MKLVFLGKYFYCNSFSQFKSAINSIENKIQTIIERNECWFYENQRKMLHAGCKYCKWLPAACAADAQMVWSLVRLVGPCEAQYVCSIGPL